jgi:alanyl-tRNA synthetase
MSVKTKRLYYDDSYLLEFESAIVDRSIVEGQPAVVLSESAFYPTSGGQPNDIGVLNGIPVVDVIAENGVVLHVVEQTVETDTVKGQIEWSRRFDHMRHHSGQHILTRAFIEVADAETVSFHLSDNSVTIDLDYSELTQAQIDSAEDLANQIVAENRAVKVWFPESDELDALQLRKISEKVTGAVRVVDIGGFDVTACGGTHVGRTGEIGMIKIIRTDKMKGKLTRVEFRCGDRALQDYREKNLFLNELAAQFTTSYQQIPDIIEKLRQENKTVGKSLSNVRRELIGYQVVALIEATKQQVEGNFPLVVAKVFEDYASGDLQQMAAQLSQNPNTIALLGLCGDSAHLVFARSEDVDIDVVPLLKAALSMLGTDRGGGRPQMAQGGGITATQVQVEAAIGVARKSIEA